MREIRIETVDHLPTAIIAISTHYPDRHYIEPHHHRRGQLISGATGVIVLTTPTGTHVMPPQRGMWIPPETRHHVRTIGAVQMQSLYVEPDAALKMPASCEVVGISPLMRNLITEAVNVPLGDKPDARSEALIGLIHHELIRLPILPLSLQYPAHAQLAALCRQFMERPRIHQTIDDWSRALGMSRRAFTRMFRRETNLSFMAWRQQACLMSAVPRLAAGESVTEVAMDLGYENPAAFTVMFKRAFGSAPLVYVGRRHAAEPDERQTRQP